MESGSNGEIRCPTGHWLLDLIAEYLPTYEIDLNTEIAFATAAIGARRVSHLWESGVMDRKALALSSTHGRWWVVVGGQTAVARDRLSSGSGVIAAGEREVYQFSRTSCGSC